MATGERGGAGAERAFAAPLPEGGDVVLDPEEARHLVRVRRVAVGDEVVLVDGRGGARRGRLLEASRERTVVRIEGPASPRVPARRVAVAVAFPASSRADDLVAALGELGVERLVPLLATRSAVDAERAAGRRARWERIAREALKVNGSATSLAIGEPAALDALLERTTREGTFVPVMLHTDPALPSLAAVLGSVPSPLLLVGPEGGFTEAERKTASDRGVPAASLGACALRTETAAIAAAAVALAR
jgi:16S rRNA (uracil1498-N3)-methyltransferase